LELVEFDNVEKNKVIAKVDAAIFQKQVIPMFLEKT
jgi:hypothetical protein